jgi:signal transduction histidine kinase
MIRLRLKTRILTILGGIVLITLCGGSVLVWYTFRMERMLAAITGEDLSALQAAESLEKALIHQKGFVSYFFMDGNPEWLQQMEKHRQLFAERLSRIKAGDGRELPALETIETEFARYVEKKNRVIALYQGGDMAAGMALHREARGYFDALIRHCEEFKQVHTDHILAVSAQNHEQAVRLRAIALAAILAAAGLTVLLAFVFVHQILEPLRRLTAEANRVPNPAGSENEVKALSRSVRGLLQDVDQTQTELERSRESLVQSEKLALVGKLAAGMAHSIRNPFTSVKMRLFSLARTLELDAAQQEDFEVIAAEIRHIDVIVQNFLEFSRPPKLKMQATDPSGVVDAVVQLLGHRLKSHDVAVRVDRPAPLPAVTADPEQLKEALVNIVVNACEAMPGGGDILIEERASVGPGAQRAAVIRVHDTGPGIPAAVQERIFQPFFSTKPDGTGLGLSIARRIVADHRGRLEAASTERQGATFIMTLPARESADEQDPDR